MSHEEDCKKFLACLSAHFDGELDGELAVMFKEHLRTCEQARVLVRTFERTIVLHRDAHGKTLPPDMHRRLMAAIEACSRGEEDE